MSENPAPSAGPLDVVGIGNAIVDVISPVDEAFLAEHDLVKGAMGLIDADRADHLYGAMPPAEESSGGSVANTIAGVASFGGSGGFIGKVRDDQLGDIFTHDIRSLGIVFEGAPATEGPSTARCLIAVTPDAERTLSTFLGTAGLLGPDDVDEALVARGKVVLAEGYLWDVPSAKDAIVKAMDHARAAGNRVALSLSDSFCVDRYRDEFLALVQERVDVLFANEAEITSLYQVDSWEAARDQVHGSTPHAPHLLIYEISNVALKKHRRQEAHALPGLAHALTLDIELHEVDMAQTFALAQRYQLSACDASYLWLAGALRCPLATFDETLAQAAQQHLGALG